MTISSFLALFFICCSLIFFPLALFYHTAFFPPLNIVWHSLPASRLGITCRLFAVSFCNTIWCVSQTTKGNREEEGVCGEGRKREGEDGEDGRLVCGSVSQTVQHFLCYQLSVWENSIPPSILSSGIDKDGPDYSSLHKGKLIPQGQLCVSEAMSWAQKTPGGYLMLLFSFEIIVLVWFCWDWYIDGRQYNGTQWHFGWEHLKRL